MTDGIPDIDTRPLVDDRGHAILFDLWVGGRWVGSRRTVRQCEEWLSSFCGVSIEATAGTPW